jgi:putative tryptophan/tyrosine transport system substrate-binding protein
MLDVRRREFITLLGGAAAAWQLAARGEAAERVRRIGVLVGFADDDPEIKRRLAAFRRGLEDLGWSEGRNTHIDIRYSPAGARVQALANELVTLKPDVILADTTTMAAAVQRQTPVIPIVFVGVSDPIGSGFIASLARPGGNLTGLLLYEQGITGKWLAMLKEFAPNLARAALITNPKTTPSEYFLRSAMAAAPALAIDIVSSQVENAADIARSIESFARTPGTGLVLPPDSTIVSNREVVVALAAQHHLPAVYALRIFVAVGGLMSYGTDRVDEYRRSASYVDRILRGAKPSDLPVQAPTRYETAINLKAAKALGLDVPPMMLAIADEVIE